MLDNSRSRWLNIDSDAGQPLYSLAPRLEEGMALTGIFENGLFAATITPTPTIAQTPFLGFCFSWYETPTSQILTETYTVPATSPYTVPLGSTPLNPTTGILVKTASGTKVNYNAAGGSGNYTVSGNTLTFDAAQAGQVFTATYGGNITVAQAIQLVGDGYIGTTRPSDVTGTIGLIRQGVIYTSNFNPGVDYSDPSIVLRVGPNGIVDPSYTAGPVIPGYVKELPSAEVPYLGLYFHSK
jgi:hypothetical protein